MPLVATEHDPAARRRVIPVFLQHAVAGLLVMLGFTYVRIEETRRIFNALGPDGAILIVLLFGFAVALALLKFPLTDQIFVSLVITAYIATVPLLGLVLSSWLVVAAAILQRVLAMMQIGPSKIDMRDSTLEWSRTVAMFGTYGIPGIAATLTYEAFGGTIPTLQPSVTAAWQIGAAGLVLIVTNNLIVSRVEQAYGYSLMMSWKLAVIDSSIDLVTIPYAILTTFAYGAMGWGGVLASAFTGVLANLVGRKLALTRSDREELIQRLSSLTNIGKTISLRCSTDELLTKIYTECRKVIDVSIFSIALVDEEKKDLSFEMNIEHGKEIPKSRLPIGDGLNSWVVLNGKPLLLGSARDEQKMGLTAYDDGIRSESWLGVPMIAGESVIGVISVQSFERNAFRDDDLVLLTAIANQAAVAIENAKLYKDLEAMNVELEQRVALRTNELRETNLRLLAADRSKNQFLASMSHELRTPLNAIIGFSSILLDAATTLPPRLYKFVENIRTAGSHLLELINDILDLAKIESGKLELQPVSFDLRETIAAVERVIKGIAAEHDVTIVTSVEHGIATVSLDESRVKQILLNLLSNAVKFSHRGGFVYLSAAPIAAAESPLGCDSVRLEVTDRGVGIPPDELPRIFDEFYQVTENRRHRKGGTGLGLSLTRNFVEMHHGTIGVQSEPERGACFTIHLPCDLQQAPRLPIAARSS